MLLLGLVLFCFQYTVASMLVASTTPTTVPTTDAHITTKQIVADWFKRSLVQPKSGFDSENGRMYKSKF